MPDLPREIRLEVKTSRAGSIPIGERDLVGVGNSGYVVALINDRLLRGPRWSLLRAAGVHARTYAEFELAELAETSPLADELNRGWSNWILDREVWGRLFEAGTTGVTERVTWCRQEHPPREHKFSGAHRETKLASALDAFRARIDAAAPIGTGSQIEGQIHQALLGDVLEQMGYAVTLNPVGVPDIVATLRITTAAGAVMSDVVRVVEWQPDSAGLRAVRDAMLRLTEEEIRRIAHVFRGSPP